MFDLSEQNNCLRGVQERDFFFFFKSSTVSSKNQAKLFFVTVPHLWGMSRIAEVILTFIEWNYCIIVKYLNFLIT